MPAHKKTNRTVKSPTKNITAYTLYLKGLHYWNKRTPADIRKAIKCFEQAIDVEPTYAQAYAMMAGAHSYLGAIGHELPHKAFKLVQQYADKALQLDDTIAGGYIAQASVYLFYEWKWKEAYELLQKAIRLNPGAIDAYELLSFYYIVIGQKEQAVKIIEEAIEIDPLSPVINHALGNVYVFAERYDDAIRQADKLLEIHPDRRISIEMKGWAVAMKGNWEAALKLFEEVHRLTNHPLKGLMGLGFAYAKTGQKEKVMEVIQKMEQRQREEPGAVIDAERIG